MRCRSTSRRARCRRHLEHDDPGRRCRREVARLKEEQNLLKYGTGELDRTLLAEGLVDELHVWVFPVLAAGGDSLLDGIETTHLKLVETTPFASGIVVNTYAPA